MEMDFSRSGSIHSSTGYMEMKPGGGGGITPTPRNESSSSSGYVEMKPGSEKGRTGSESSPYIDMTSGSSPARVSYISVAAGGSDVPPYYTKNTTTTTTTTTNDYIDMSFKKRTTSTSSSNYQLSPAKSSVIGSPDSHFGGSHKTPEGYVEMSVGRGHHRQNSLDGCDDYTNMTLGSGAKKNSGKTSLRSLPIAIQNPGKNTTGASSSSSSPMYAVLGRKFSTGTPPTMQLPLADSTPYSSLPRSRKNSRPDSKDSSSSSLTTPSSSSTIFPLSLNSPCSPVKPGADPALPAVTIKVPPAVLSTVYKKPKPDYVSMDFDLGRNSSDYVNYQPKVTQTHLNTTELRTNQTDSHLNSTESDYAVMKPGVRVTSSPLANRVAMLTLSASFRPINENIEQVSDPAECSSRPLDSDAGLNTPDPPYEVLRTGVVGRSRPSSTSSELCSSSGSTVVGGSRPDSVNSDRIRPSSTTDGVQLHYASLDLEDGGSRSPRTIKSSGEQGQGEPVLTYAAIDFVKSEGLKHNNNNSKVKQ